MAGINQLKPYILFNEIEKKDLKFLVEKISIIPKLTIGEIKLVDLIIENKSMTGIYIIFDESAPVYVGKTGSRAILERLAGHFDLRPNAYMNSFLCALAGKRKQRKGACATSEDILNVYESALKHKLIFIQIPNEKSDAKIIGKLENILSQYYQTKYNHRRSKKIINLNLKITEI